VDISYDVAEKKIRENASRNVMDIVRSERAAAIVAPGARLKTGFFARFQANSNDLLFRYYACVQYDIIIRTYKSHIVVVPGTG